MVHGSHGQYTRKKTGEEIMGLFKELNERGRTIILVTHDLSLTRYANKIIRLRDGKVENTENVKKGGKTGNRNAYKQK